MNPCLGEIGQVAPLRAMGIRSCPDATFGGVRRGIDPEKAHDDFVNGTVDGGELDERAIDFTVLTRTSEHAISRSERTTRNRVYDGRLRWVFGFRIPPSTDPIS